MYGRLIRVFANDPDTGRVDTRNDALGELTIYQLPKGIATETTVIFQVKVSQKTGRPYAVFQGLADRNQSLFNTENRSQWYQFGEAQEEDFIAKIVPFLGVDLIINPQKVQDPTAIDLWDQTHHRPADLKVQKTPFFKSDNYAYKGQQCVPRYTVTFNRKDYEKYKLAYPDCDIYFWVSWEQLDFKEKHVEPLRGVWRASFSKMADCIDSGLVSCHRYKYRMNDDHNAQDSYLFMLSDEEVFQRLL